MVPKIARYTIYVVALVVVVLALLLFVFTYIPLVPRLLGSTQSEAVSVGNESTSLDKAIISKACTGDGKTCIDNVLLLSGYIDQGMIERIDYLTNAHKINTVCFATRGGSKEFAIKIGEWINKNHKNTCMAEKYLTSNDLTIKSPLCASACPYLLAMGVERTALGSNFKIGIHSSGSTWDFGIFSFETSSSRSNAIKGYKEMLANSSNSSSHLQMLYDSLDTRFDSKRYLSSEEQKQYALFTEYH